MGSTSARGAAIAGWPLLHDESAITWRDWFTQMGRPDVDTVSGMNFSVHALMVDAAVAGHGAALASVVCAQPYLSTGALVPLDGPTFSQPAYRIYCDLRTYEDEQVRRVHDWFIRSAARTAPD
jgi:LysR family glycine cleavage system transcriptional activator